MKIFNFHPIHVALNMEQAGRYAALRQRHAVPEVTRGQTAQYAATAGPGAGTFLKSLLAAVRSSKEHSPMNGATGSALAAAWRRQCASR